MTRTVTALALAVAVGLAMAVSPFASAHPDGLEKVAQEESFVQRGHLHAIQEDAPLSDYAFPGVQEERLATGLAGFAGTIGVFVLGSGLLYVMRRRDR